MQLARSSIGRCIAFDVSSAWFTLQVAASAAGRVGGLDKPALALVATGGSWDATSLAGHRAPSSRGGSHGPRPQRHHPRLGIGGVAIAAVVIARLTYDVGVGYLVLRNRRRAADAVRRPGEHSYEHNGRGQLR